MCGAFVTTGWNRDGLKRFNELFATVYARRNMKSERKRDQEWSAKMVKKCENNKKQKKAPVVVEEVILPMVDGGNMVGDYEESDDNEMDSGDEEAAENHGISEV